MRPRCSVIGLPCADVFVRYPELVGLTSLPSNESAMSRARFFLSPNIACCAGVALSSTSNTLKCFSRLNLVAMISARMVGR